MSERAKQHLKPACFDPIRHQAATFIRREKARSAIPTSVLASRIGNTRPKDLSKLISEFNSDIVEDVGIPYLFRVVEALGYDVRVEFVPRGERAAA